MKCCDVPSVNRPSKPVDLILDTDMGNDIDDALALAMIHGLEARGECRLRGVSVSKDNPYAPIYVDIVNTFYGRPDIPIGMVRGGVTPDDRTFIREVSTARDGGRLRYPRTHRPGEYPEAVSMLRSLLTDAPDQSVTLVMIGFSTNVARLLDSQPDEYSPLPGGTLFKRKVAHVVAMAANFAPASLASPSLETREYNILKDIPSAQRFFHHCPVPVILSGYEVGCALQFPCDSIEHEYGWAKHHPVAEAYRSYLPMPYDRPSWDLTAVLAAVRPDVGHFRTSDPGVLSIDDDGITHFDRAADGPHRYLVLNEERREDVLQEFRRLCAHQPAGCARSPAHRRCDRCARADLAAVRDPQEASA